MFDCTPQLGDSDGDGIPDNRDPWPAECNALIDAQVFPPATEPWTTNANVTETPTGLELDETGHLGRDYSDVHVFFETTVTLGAISDPDDWGSGIHLIIDDGDATPDVVNCALFQNTAAAPPGPNLRLGHADRPGAGSYGIFPPISVDVSAGQRYVLQLWIERDGHPVCRLADENGVIQTARSRFSHPSTGLGEHAGTILLTSGRRRCTFERVLLVVSGDANI